jgi:uncharacterized repeat protein (TIGR03803 family)
MKTILRLMTATTIALVLAAFSTPAATFTNYYTFSANSYNEGSLYPDFTNSDGYYPYGFTVSGNTLYGVAFYGGTGGVGTLFRIDTDGHHFTNLYEFPAPIADPQHPGFLLDEGISPTQGLLIVGNTIYGTTFSGGPKSFGLGTVFSIDTGGQNFQSLGTFTNYNGQNPNSGVTLVGNTLYGTTRTGGTNGLGSIFAAGTDGSGITTVYNFTNADDPYGGLVLFSNDLYGFTQFGGVSSNGSVYRVSGASLTTIFSFSGTNGMYPYATPTLSGNTLYGTTFQGGKYGYGTVFKINTDSSGFTNFYNFTTANGANIDGAEPYFGVILSGNTLYGTTSTSGSGGQGTVYQVNTDGSDFTNLYDFSYSDGANPTGVALVGNTLYGTAASGGSTGSGEIFGLILAPPPVPLNIVSISNTVVLSWSAPSLSLYTASTITNVFTKINGATSPYTNVISGAQKYFRLE